MFSIIVSVCSGIASIAAILMMVFKVFRNLNTMHEGQLCLLRQQILTIYYAGKDTQKIDSYARTSLDYLVEAYRALGGNSFIDDVYARMRTWEVID